MKKVFIILLGATLFISCNETKKSDGEAHAAMIESTMKSDSTSQEIGYQISDNGESSRATLSPSNNARKTI